MRSGEIEDTSHSKSLPAALCKACLAADLAAAQVSFVGQLAGALQKKK